MLPHGSALILVCDLMRVDLAEAMTQLGRPLIQAEIKVRACVRALQLTGGGVRRFWATSCAVLSTAMGTTSCTATSNQGGSLRPACMELFACDIVSACPAAISSSATPGMLCWGTLGWHG